MARHVATILRIAWLLRRSAVSRGDGAVLQAHLIGFLVPAPPPLLYNPIYYRRLYTILLLLLSLLSLLLLLLLL